MKWLTYIQLIVSYMNQTKNNVDWLILTQKTIIYSPKTQYINISLTIYLKIFI